MITLARPALFPARSRVPLPRTWPIGTRTIVLALAASGLLVAGLWFGHGGLARLATPAGVATGVGQLTALMGTWLALVQVLLMARVPWIDHVVGTDRLMAWHRVTGFACLWLLVGHALFTSVGWAMTGGGTWLDEIAGLLSTWDVLIAVVGLALLGLVAVSSVKAARRRLAYETWYGLHLYAYIGIALAFVHELTLGTDLANDPLALTAWLGLYAIVFGLLFAYRVVAPGLLSLRHRLRVAAVTPEGPDAVSIRLTGRGLERLAVRGGQYFHVRFLTRGGWWRPHPFSISAAPDGRSLRFTIKDLGDDSHRMLHMPVGVPVFIEGPYGAFTAARIRRPRVVMIAGGIGVTPLRAILEELPADVPRVTLLMRAARWEDVVHRDELDSLARERGAEVCYLVGHRGSPEMPVDPLAPGWLARLVPDLASADVLVCGSRSFTRCVLHSLRMLGVPSGQVHAERFGY